MSVVLSADAETAYVSTGRGQKVFIVDTATDKVTGSVQAGQRPWGIGLSPDGKYLYAANGPSNNVSIIDLTTKNLLQDSQCRDEFMGRPRIEALIGI